MSYSLENSYSLELATYEHNAQDHVKEIATWRGDDKNWFLTYEAAEAWRGLSIKVSVTFFFK